MDVPLKTLPFPSLWIRGFRGLSDLRLEDCGRVNLLVGGNNSGKTSVLEAMLLLAAPMDVRQWEGAVELRSTWPLADIRFGGGGSGRLDALSWLFPHGEEAEQPIRIQTGGAVRELVATARHLVGEPPEQPVVSDDEYIEASKRRSYQSGLYGASGPEAERGLAIEVEARWNSDLSTHGEAGPERFRMVLWESGLSYRGPKPFPGPSVSVAYATPISHRSDGYLAARVSRVLRAKRLDQTVRLLQRLDPRVKDLVMIAPREIDDRSPVPIGSRPPSLHVEYEGAGLVPIQAMGDGLRRALHLAAVVTDVSEGGVLLVDEIEVGMHTTVLEEVFGWLCEACAEAGVQLFATTHSLEAVDAILEGAPDDDLVLYRLRKGRAKRFDGPTLRTLRFELGQEVR